MIVVRAVPLSIEECQRLVELIDGELGEARPSRTGPEWSAFEEHCEEIRAKLRASIEDEGYVK